MFDAVGFEGISWTSHVICSVDLNAKLNESAKSVKRYFLFSTD